METRIVKRRADGSYDYPVGREHVGAGILDIVSGAMYGDKLDVLREYIQNAVDGEAREVRIRVHPDEIVIWDNGHGMEPEQLDEARKIAVSQKGSNQVGFRGIGIYSSFSVCEAVEVTTRPASHSGVYVLEFQHARIRDEGRRALEGDRSALPLLDALDQYTTIRDATRLPEDDDGCPFTMVRLIRPVERFRERLDNANKVRNYLRTAVPLAFDPDFDHSAEILQLLQQERHVGPMNLVHVTLTTSDGKDFVFLRPGAPNLLRPLVRIVKHSESRTPLAVYWACLSRERGVISPKEMRGFQMRFKGFGIGDRHLPERFWGRLGSGTTYGWLTGEIYVLDGSLIPLSDRSNFEDSHARDRLYEALKKEFAELNRLIDHRRQRTISIEELGAEAERSVIERAFTELEKLGRKWDVEPPMSRRDLVTPKALQILERFELSELVQPEESGAITKPDGGRGSEGRGGGQPGGGGGTRGGGDTGSGSGGAKGASSSNGGTSGAGTHESPPSIADIILEIGWDWPERSRAVFDEIDGALVETTPLESRIACQWEVQRRIQRLLQEEDDRDLAASTTEWPST